jgi:hypothetical protein
LQHNDDLGKTEREWQKKTIRPADSGSRAIFFFGSG